MYKRTAVTRRTIWLADLDLMYSEMKREKK